MRVPTPASGLVALWLCAATGCGSAHTQPNTALGRVVIYRNGVAYFERSAVIDGDRLELSVPDAELDDFLKSLSVQDEVTGAGAPVSYHASSGGNVDLRVRLPGASPHRVRVSYVTEAPAWKPSYRVTLKGQTDLALQAWAIVDNASGEDWNRVRLGVGSSAALAFRYDLRSLRNVARDRVEPQGLTTLAPPTGGAPYGAATPGLVASLDERALRVLDGEAETPAVPAEVASKLERGGALLEARLRDARRARDVVRITCIADKAAQLKVARRALDQAASEVAPLVAAALSRRADQLLSEANLCIGEEAAYGGGSTQVMVTTQAGAETPPDSPAPRPPLGGAKAPYVAPPRAEPNPADASLELDRKLNELRAVLGREKYRVRVLSDSAPGGSMEEATRRGELLKSRLLQAGVPAERVSVEARRGERAEIRLVTEPLPANIDAAPRREGSELEPVSNSTFEFADRLDVPRNSSVMLALYSGKAEGEVTYLYDADGPRGNSRFPFRAIRFRNPTRSMLESGPLTVVSEGRFLGEGVSDPIPPGAWAMVPFALDRQIVAERETSETESIARIVGARRGKFSVKLERTRRTHVQLFSRLSTRAEVFLRHVPAPGHALRKSPGPSQLWNGAHLFRFGVPSQGKAEAEIVEVVSRESVIDIRTPDGAKLLLAHVDTGAAPDNVRTQVRAVLGSTEELRDLTERLNAKRSQQKELRDRLHQLEVEVFTLRTVKSSGRLLVDLERKLASTRERVSKSTSDLVDLEDRSMVAKIRLEDALAELDIQNEAQEPGLAKLP